MDGGASYPRTVEEVFRDFKGRRAAMIKDVEEFYKRCDPDARNGSELIEMIKFWSQRRRIFAFMDMPASNGRSVYLLSCCLQNFRNFSRDGMPEKDWLSLVAVHSDTWLLAVAFYFGGRVGFDKADRKRLFNMINDLPTLFEVVTGVAKKQTEEKSSVSNHSSNKSEPNSKRGSESQPEYPKAVVAKEEGEDAKEEEDDEEHRETLCGACEFAVYFGYKIGFL